MQIYIEKKTHKKCSDVLVIFATYKLGNRFFLIQCNPLEIKLY